ncbi:uncharacterized protein VTP21DRAFT_4688 [Calcarisporiella thermophila]|uniref:uncharacterized protein n=1 Tax=Calcarisporiella thermophila TaxID=911321 RepID=UPI003742CF0E
MSAKSARIGLNKKEIEARVSLLKSSKELSSLHQELVQSKHITEDEFWNSPTVKKIRQRLRNEEQQKQTKGKSSAWVDLRPGTEEGGKDVKYTLTPQIINDIFVQYPSVKRAYDRHVPDQLSEVDFWKRFLVSQFFHRSRTGARSSEQKDDIFDKCLEEEDEEALSAPKGMKIDHIRRTIDLSATEEDHIVTGNQKDFTMVPGKVTQSLSLIRRFNRHAIQVLDATGKKQGQEANKENSDSMAIDDEIILEDLKEAEPPAKVVLDIQDQRRYFESQSGAQLENKTEDPIAVFNEYRDSFATWQPDLTKQTMDNKTARQVMDKLNSVIKAQVENRTREKQTDNRISPSILQRILSYQASTNEILRHFWASLEMDRSGKNARMVEALRKSQEKMNELLIAANAEGADLDRIKTIMQPLNVAVNKALETAATRAAKKRTVK